MRNILQRIKDIYKYLTRNHSGNSCDSSCDNSCSSELTPYEYHNPENKITLSDLAIVVGDYTLYIVDDKGIIGLHSYIDIDYCSCTRQDCLNEMSRIINENLKELSEISLIQLSDYNYIINIADCINTGAFNEDSEYYKQRCEKQIEVFYPIIKEFIEKYKTCDNVGLLIFCDFVGTNIGLSRTKSLLENDGYKCYGAGASIDKASISPILKSEISNWNDYEFVDNVVNVRNIFRLGLFMHKLALMKNELELFAVLKQHVSERLRQKNNICAPKSCVENSIKKKTSSIEVPVSYKSMQYGQCRTFADIVKNLNDKNHYSTTDDLLKDFGFVINDYQKRGTVDVIFVQLFLSIIQDHQTEIFENGIFCFSKFVIILEKCLSNKESKDLEVIFEKREKAKLLILLQTLNDICLYTDLEKVCGDIEDVVLNWSLKKGKYVMNDPYPYIGNYPINHFISGLTHQWDNLLKDGILSNELLEDVMFSKHERDIQKYGLANVINRDFEDDGPCHPEVFYPKNEGTAPIYVKDELSRQYLKACGEGKGPRSGHMLYEMTLVKPILERETQNGKYELIDGRFYVPVDSMQKPVFCEYYGKLYFASEEEKRKFLDDLRLRKRGC